LLGSFFGCGGPVTGERGADRVLAGLETKNFLLLATFLG